MKSFNGSFRIDSKLSPKNSLTIHGGAHETKGRQWDFERNPLRTVIKNTEDTHGEYVSAKLNHSFSETSNMELQFYIDHNEGDVIMPLRIEETIFDADLTHHFMTEMGHEIVWGLGARHIKDEVEDTGGAVPFLKSDFDRKDSYSKYNFLIQDSIWIKPDKFKATVGAKWEHNHFTGSDFMPNLRLLYTPNKNHAIWAAASRSSSVPTRYEIAGTFIGTGVPGGGTLQ